MPRRRKHDDHENLERWLLTYADLITLLLAFFIVMYSMSKVDAKRFGKMQEALAGVLKGGSIAIKKGNEVGAMPGQGVLEIGHLKSLGQKIEESVLKSGNEKMISTEMTERGLVIHIMESALFREGSAELEPRAKQTLDLVAKDIGTIPNHIRIEGHTDNKPINTVRFPSNWELSSARATEVVRYLVETHGVQSDRISALGYGEFRPMVSNETDEGRSKNRRVDIVVLTMEMSATEPTSDLYTPKI
ncbi:MAG: OmpA family protein [Candidatus Zixiibacteriota bacterium]|jgi:chemotaxis protein MotB